MGEEGIAASGLRVGFTFAFPTRMESADRGVLLKWTKEWDLPDLVGRDPVPELARACREAGLQGVKVNVLLNDTVGTLILGYFRDRRTLAGGILGTGTNLAAWLGSTAINFECGNFDFGPLRDRILTPVDRDLDSRSRNPGQQRFEKMVAGRYLGGLLRRLLAGIHPQGRFNERGAVDAEDLSHLAADAGGLPETRRFLERWGLEDNLLEQRRQAVSLARMILRRSAQLSALAMIATAEWADPELEDHHLMTVDGSLFEHAPGYPEAMRRMFRNVLGSRAERIECRLVKDGSGIGAALASSAVEAGRSIDALGETDMSSPIRPAVRRIRILFLGGLLISFAYSMQLRRHRQIEVPPPSPPPPVEAGADAATLNLKIVERGSDTPVSATVSVNEGAVEGEEAYLEHSLRRSANRHKGPIRFRPLNYYFYTDGTLSLRVPPGRCTVEVGKGYEFIPSHRTFELDPGQVLDATVTLSRWIDMAALGWYSGDTHIHFDRTGTNDDSLLTLTSARDIRYAFSLSMNTRGYSLGGAFESWHQAHGLGDGSTRNRGPYFLTSGQEYRTRTLGHVTILMARDYVPGIGHTPNTDRGPSLGVIGDQAHALGGVIGLNHGGYTRLEADSLALSGKMDFLELLQFGGYRGLGLDGWYDFLNLGYRWPMVGASDYPATRELGDCLTYVRASEPPTPRGFLEGLLRGESFATSGPMLLVTVNGKQPGESILAGRTPVWSCKWRSESPAPFIRSGTWI